MFKSTQMIAIGLLAVSTAVWAHDPPDEIRNAVQFPAGAEPTIDGDCSDWDAIPGDQYWITNADLYPAYGGHHHDEGAAKGDIDVSSFDVTWRLGWSATTNQLYYCNSVFDDRHVIDRADPTGWDWWQDDGCEYFYTTRHLSEQEVRDLGAENINTYWGYNYALPKLPPPATWWMVIGICAGCDWLDTGSEFYTLEYTFEGEEYGESTYHYEQQSLPLDHWVGGLEAEDKTPAMYVPATLSEGQTIHYTFFQWDDDALFEDEGGSGKAWTNRSTDGGSWLGQGDLFLEPVNPGIAWPTAVQSNSWGRIKAQF